MINSIPQQTYRVEIANAGRRLDTWLRQREPEVPLGALMRWLRVGRVRVDGKRVKGQTRLALGQNVTWPLEEIVSEDLASVAPFARPPSKETRSKISLLKKHLVYEDEALLVLDKPALVACHAGTGHDAGLMGWVEAYLGDSVYAVGCRPGLIQRLDRGVSGLVPIGKYASALRDYGAFAAAGSLVKTYLALVDGEMTEEQGLIDAPLTVGDEPMGDRPRTFVDPLGKPAKTFYRRLSVARGTTLVAVRLETGRTHQIRAHFLHLGHRLIGDPRYGWSDTNAFARETLGVMRPLLHGFCLGLPACENRAAQTMSAPLPTDFSRALRHYQHDPLARRPRLGDAEPPLQLSYAGLDAAFSSP